MIDREILVVGAGFAGCVVSRQLAEAGHAVYLIDRRYHIGGNAYDAHDAHGILIHHYGPHIFHTNSERVFNYLSRFTSWHPYEHRVKSVIKGELYPFPVNRDTLNKLYGLNLDEKGAADFLERAREPREKVRTSEDVILNSVGKDLYEKFFLNYTKKQWGVSPAELKAGVAARIPVRTNTDDRYFTDSFQAMPLHGYTAMFESMLGHENIRVETGVDYFSLRGTREFRHIVYTGPIDSFYDHCYGKLPYRSLRFEHEHLENIDQYQEVGTVNFPNDHEYTRITEFKHMTGQVHNGTSIVREYPQSDGDPYYPVPKEENERLFKKYDAKAREESDVTFVGRLAQYRYYNMDQVVGAALVAAEKLLDKLK